MQKGNCDPQVRNQTLKIKSLSDYRKSIVNNIIQRLKDHRKLKLRENLHDTLKSKCPCDDVMTADT